MFQFSVVFCISVVFNVSVGFCVCVFVNKPNSSSPQRVKLIGFLFEADDGKKV